MQRFRGKKEKVCEGREIKEENIDVMENMRGEKKECRVGSREKKGMKRESQF